MTLRKSKRKQFLFIPPQDRSGFVTELLFITLRIIFIFICKTVTKVE